MRSIYDSGSRPPEDLTARARIRDAAMAQFAERGFKEATIKRVAEAAGVSTGLVQHHFGTKDGLRQACDEAALETIRRQLQLIENLDSSRASNPDFAATLYSSSPLLVRYLIRLLADGAPAAAPLFDEMADVTEKFLSDAMPERFPPGSEQARDGATMMGVMHLGAAVLNEQVSRRTGVSFPDPASGPRLGLVILDIYTAMGRWVASETGIQARAALVKYLENLEPSTQKGGKEHNDV